MVLTVVPDRGRYLPVLLEIKNVFKQVWWQMGFFVGGCLTVMGCAITFQMGYTLTPYYLLYQVSSNQLYESS